MSPKSHAFEATRQNAYSPPKGSKYGNMKCTPKKKQIHFRSICSLRGALDSRSLSNSWSPALWMAVALLLASSSAMAPCAMRSTSSAEFSCLSTLRARSRMGRTPSGMSKQDPANAQIPVLLVNHGAICLNAFEGCDPSADEKSVFLVDRLGRPEGFRDSLLIYVRLCPNTIIHIDSENVRLLPLPLCSSTCRCQMTSAPNLELRASGHTLAGRSQLPLYYRPQKRSKNPRSPQALTSWNEELRAKYGVPLVWSLGHHT